MLGPNKAVDLQQMKRRRKWENSLSICIRGHKALHYGSLCHRYSHSAPQIAQHLPPGRWTEVEGTQCSIGGTPHFLKTTKNVLEA